MSENGEDKIGGKVLGASKTPAMRRIEPTEGWISLDIQEMKTYRELLYFLTWKDIKVRYKQTVIGMSWAILQPLCTMVVFSIFFGRLAKMPSDGIPYPLFNYSALLPWILFANGVTKSANSLVGNANILKKVYFPRIFLPLSSIMAGFLDFVLAFIILIGMVYYYEMAPTGNVIWLPFFTLAAMFTSLGIGLVLSALNVQFRDIGYIVPFLVQLWMFITPVVYPTSLLDERWRILYALNPMVGVVDGFRWALLGVGQPPGLQLVISLSVTVILLVGGIFYFRRMEKTFADVV